MRFKQDRCFNVNCNFVIDENRAINIARVLIDLFKQKPELVNMPEYQFPKNLIRGGREHALYFTYVISIDYGTDSEKLWHKARSAYELNPEIFTPERILAMDENVLREFLGRLGARYNSSAVRVWKEISRNLVEIYDGDPRNITAQPLTVAEIKERISRFPNLRGPKLSNFFIRAMVEMGLFKVKDLDDLDLPVDKQVARFTIYTGVLQLNGGEFEGSVNDNPLRSLIQEIWRKAAKAVGTAPWKLDQPIWIIGSKMCAVGIRDKCPVINICEKKKDVIFRENRVIWDADAKDIQNTLGSTRIA